MMRPALERLGAGAEGGRGSARSRSGSSPGERPPAAARGRPAVITGPGQESVWDYPRPPRLEPSGGTVVVVFGGEVVADSRRAVRVLETSHPPGYYIPADDWRPGALVPADGCEHLRVEGRRPLLRRRRGRCRGARCRLGLPAPEPALAAAIAGCVSVYPGRMDRCEVDGVAVTAQDGGFYGGWVTVTSSARSRAAPAHGAGSDDETRDLPRPTDLAGANSPPPSDARLAPVRDRHHRSGVRADQPPRDRQGRAVCPLLAQPQVPAPPAGRRIHRPVPARSPHPRGRARRRPRRSISASWPTTVTTRWPSWAGRTSPSRAPRTS